MALKTQTFDEQLTKDMELITVNKKFPYSVKGSYSRKKFGSMISDIDFTGRVIYNKSLCHRLSDIISTPYDSFTFLNFSFGLIDQLVVPWDVNSTGDCYFNHQDSLKWLHQAEPFLSKDHYKMFQSILTPEEVSVADLISIKNILLENYEIQWTPDRLRSGFAEIGGNKYYALKEMEKNSVVLEFAYHQKGGTICGVDIGLEDKKFKKGLPDVMDKFYLGDYYSIFKSLGKRLKPTSTTAYEKILKDLEPITYAKYSLELANTLESKRPDLSAILREEVERRVGDVEIDDLTNHRSHLVTAFVEDYRNLIELKELKDFSYRMNRGMNGRVKRRGELLTYSSENFSMISWAVTRTLMDLDLMLDCVRDTLGDGVSQEKVSEFLKYSIQQNDLILFVRENKLELFNRNLLMDTYDLADLKEVQQVILTTRKNKGIKLCDSTGPSPYVIMTTERACRTLNSRQLLSD